MREKVAIVGLLGFVGFLVGIPYVVTYGSSLYRDCSFIERHQTELTWSEVSGLLAKYQSRSGYKLVVGINEGVVPPQEGVFVYWSSDLLPDRRCEVSFTDEHIRQVIVDMGI